MCIPVLRCLQSHVHRSEHWIVVAAPRVTDDRCSFCRKPVGHPLGAPDGEPAWMVLIEVQTGPYLGEDDIIRYEDIYARK